MRARFCQTRGHIKWQILWWFNTMLLDKEEKKDRDDGEWKHGQRRGVWLLQAQYSGHKQMKHNHPRDDPAKQKTHTHGKVHVNVYRIVVVFVCQRKKKEKLKNEEEEVHSRLFWAWVLNHRKKNKEDPDRVSLIAENCWVSWRIKCFSTESLDLRSLQLTYW